MPIFEIEHPDGRKFEVDAPDMNTAVAALGQMGASAAPAAPSPSLAATGMDVAKQVGSGLVTGTEMIPGALPQILGAAGRAVESVLPGDEGAIQHREALRGLIAQQRGGGVSQYLPQPETTAGKFARTAAEFVPSAAAAPGRVAANIGTGITAGLASEAAGQATEGTAAEPYARFITAAATPFALAAGRRAITPLPMPAARAGAVQALEAEGVPLSAGARTGSRPLQWFEQSLGDVPGAGRHAATTAERTAEGFTRATLRRAGIDANRATPEVLDDAFARIGGDFDRLAARNTWRPDTQFGREMRTALDDYRGLVSPPNRAPMIENFEAEIATQLARHRGGIPGDAYQSLRSRLERAARAAAGQPEVADTLRDMRMALDAAMERSLQRTGSRDLGAWQQARRQYRNMLTIERAATGAGENAALGLLSPSALRNATVAMGRRAYARGQGDFAELARAGEGVLRPLPQSGTAPRAYVQGLPAAGGAVIGSMFGGPVGAGLGAVGAMAGPPLLGRLLMSPPVQGYLGNQLLAGQPNFRNTALLGGLLGGIAGNQPLLPAR